MNSSSVRPPRTARITRIAAVGVAGCAAVVLMIGAPAYAAGTVTTLRDASIADLAAVLAGDGVSVVSAEASGADVQVASFSDVGVGTPLSGLAVSSGSLVDADPSSEDDLDFTQSALLGPNTSLTTTGDFGGPGDAALTELVGTTTYDAAVVTLEVVPVGPSLSLQYRLGSEEYAGWAEREYTDAAAIWVDGEVCSVLADGTRVGVDSVNSASNAELYVANFDGRTPGTTYDTELNGFTTALTCTADVDPGAPVSVRVAVADTVDGQLDTTVLLAADTLISAPGPTPTPTDTPTPTPTPTPTATPTATTTGVPAGGGGTALPRTGGQFDPTLALVAGGLVVLGAAAATTAAVRRRRSQRH